MSKPVVVLGVSESHVASACLLRDGVVVGSISEERLNRVKSWSGFPSRAVREVLRQAKVDPSDVDRLVLHGSAPWVYAYESGGSGQSSRLLTIRSLTNELLYRQPRAWPIYEQFRDRVYRARFYPRWLQERLQLASGESGIPVERVTYTDHHRCHAYAGLHGVLGLPEEDHLVLTNDGHGDDCCATVSIYRKGKWAQLARTPNHHSLAHLYMAVTEYLGMRPNEHEYKVMGLAPYAGVADVERVFPLFKDLVSLSGLEFRSLVPDQAYPAILRERLRQQRFDWIAGAVQLLTENLLSAWVTEAVRQTGIHRVVLSGGIFLNVKANLVIADLPEVESLTICPSPGDDSTAIGAAYWGYEQECNRRGQRFEPRSLGDLYLGPEYADEEIERSVRQARDSGLACTVRRRDEIASDIAAMLSEGEVVARFDGRMEFGARALGNRSLLAHPAHRSVIEVLNHQIKNRDFWMPFAGTLLSERQGEYLENSKSVAAPFMVLAFRGTERASADMVAAMHPADQTMRPQILDRTTNPGYYEVVKQFEARTGIGGVLNTSFNLHGEPIVCSPDDALSTFARSGLRHLAIGGFLVSKDHVTADSPSDDSVVVPVPPGPLE